MHQICYKKKSTKKTLGWHSFTFNMFQEYEEEITFYVDSLEEQQKKLTEM